VRSEKRSRSEEGWHAEIMTAAVNLGRVKDVDIRTINELFLLTRLAHLQKL
jgi:hypothetical protein